MKDQEIIATAKLSVKDFRNPDVNQKVFYEVMPGVDMQCYIRCAIGIAEDMKETNVQYT